MASTLPRTQLPLAQRLDIAHRQTADEPTDHERFQRVGSPAAALQCHFGNSLDTNGSAAYRQPGGSRSAAQPSPVCTCRERDPLRFPERPVRHGVCRRARPSHSVWNCVLDRALDDQTGHPAERSSDQNHFFRTGECTTILFAAGPSSMLPLYLRRRRYSASHGVGLLQSSVAGLEGTYAVALTAPGAYLQQSLDATARPAGALLVRHEQGRPPARGRCVTIAELRLVADALDGLPDQPSEAIERLQAARLDFRRLGMMGCDE